MRLHGWGGGLRRGLTDDALKIVAEKNTDVTVNPEYSERTGCTTATPQAPAAPLPVTVSPTVR
ncbi:hypothetical protein DXU92_04095 [Brachybacterium saurashtrense]|uniref:Uncharacterized protein n=1 Tax=Brachybacterium saurashtrense TaxID=556288 RepID=A0A345YQX1_9MICO|nr:hypothetical protein DWV08_12345 [Brachybacterium saurashtrense]RRR24063.1 hypothetical protein DXU92_04095 [Brachybacterium saurashtrense]